MSKSLFSAGSRMPRNVFASVMLESANQKPADQEPPAEPEVPEITEQALFESMEDNAMFEAVNRAAEISARSDAAAAVCQWVDEGDAEADAFESMAFGLAGGDEAEELSDDQAETFLESLSNMTDFALQLGASPEAVQGLVDGDDDAAELVFESIESALETQTSDELIADFGVREQLILEAKKKVIRDGKIVTINTKKRKRRMSAAQKAALKKARSKAHRSAGKAARKKAMRMRKSRGMK